MTDHDTFTPEQPHTTSCPYHAALYLHSLIKAAAHLVDELPGTPMVGFPSAVEMGLPGLMTVITERADALWHMLEDMDPEGWAVAQAAITAGREEARGRPQKACA